MNATPMGLTARNVNDALPIAATLFRDPESYRRIAPRTGDATLEYRVPVVTTFKQPLERVLYNAERDANPYFHFFEALWILAGRDDVAYIERFLPKMAQYSDDGETFHGAYGARMRRAHTGAPHCEEGIDQLASAIEQLKADPHTRRAVVSLWQPAHDSGYNGKDMPCNVAITFKLREGKLHMTVFNRSNDVVWGLYGANVVQFSTIMEYTAHMLGVSVGVYHHWSDSFHVYDNAQWAKMRGIDHRARFDPYEEAPCWFTGMPEVIRTPYDCPVLPYPLVQRPEIFDTELQHFINYSESLFITKSLHGVRSQYENTYFDDVALPLLNSFLAYKRGELGGAMAWARRCEATDWRLACALWLHRRAHKEQAHA